MNELLEAVVPFLNACQETETLNTIQEAPPQVPNFPALEVEAQEAGGTSSGGKVSLPSASHSGSGDPGKKDDPERRQLLIDGLKRALKNELLSHAKELLSNKEEKKRFRTLITRRFPKNRTTWEEVTRLLHEVQKDGRNHPLFMEIWSKFNKKR